jgi:DNA-binding transcriptional LysR family regulator
MQEANDEATQQQTNMQGNIKIAAGGDYSEIVIAPIISEFATLHPMIRIEMDFNNRNINLLENNVDVAIRYGQLKDSANIAQKLSSRSLMFAASQDYLDVYPVPKHPRDLKHHRCITSGSRPWQYFDGSLQRTNKKHVPVDINSVWQSNSARAMVQHAINGNGIVYLPQDTIEQFDTKRQLVPVLQEYAIQNMPTWLVYPKRQYVPIRVRALMDFIIEKLAS